MKFFLELGASTSYLWEMRRMDNWNPYGAGPLQFGSIVPGVFTPVLAKHSKSFSLIDCISVDVDRMQRNFEPMRKQVEAWQRSELTDVTAKVVIYEAFVEGDSRLQNTSPAACMTSTSSRSTRNSGRGRSGVCRMRSPPRSRAGSYPTVQGNSQAGRIPRSPVLSIVLARAGLCRPPRPFSNY